MILRFVNTFIKDYDDWINSLESIAVVEIKLASGVVSRAVEHQLDKPLKSISAEAGQATFVLNVLDRNDWVGIVSWFVQKV